MQNFCQILANHIQGHIVESNGSDVLVAFFVVVNDDFIVIGNGHVQQGFYGAYAAVFAYAGLIQQIVYAERSYQPYHLLEKHGVAEIGGTISFRPAN